jgi:hypothetical protein
MAGRNFRFIARHNAHINHRLNEASRHQLNDRLLFHRPGGNDESALQMGFPSDDLASDSATGDDRTPLCSLPSSKGCSLEQVEIQPKVTARCAGPLPSAEGRHHRDVIRSMPMTA